MGSARDELVRSARAFMAEQQALVAELAGAEERAQAEAGRLREALATAEADLARAGGELLAAMEQEDAARQVLIALGEDAAASRLAEAETAGDGGIPQETADAERGGGETLVDVVQHIVQRRPGRNFTAAEVVNILRNERPDMDHKHIYPTIHNTLRRLSDVGRIERHSTGRGVAYQARHGQQQESAA